MGDSPAFESIHELPRGIEALAHERCLLPDCDHGIVKQTGLVLGRCLRGHVGSVVVQLDGIAGGERTGGGVPVS